MPELRRAARAKSAVRLRMAEDSGDGSSGSGEVRRVLIAMDGSEHSFYAFDCE